MKNIFKKLNRIHFNKQSQNAFTLVEILLYTAIASILILSISTLAFSMIQSRERNQVMIEVEENGMQITTQLSQTIRNAVSITSPTIGTSGASLSLSVNVGADSPTVYDLSASNLRITKGAGTAVNLNSNRIQVSNVTFSNLSRASTPGLVRFQFRLTYINTSGKPEYNYFKDFVGSASLK